MRWWIAVLAVGLAGCGSSERGEHWVKARTLPGTYTTFFVRVLDGGIKKRAVYEEAANALCNYGDLCKVYFFAEKTQLPTATTTAELLNDKDWDFNSLLATWVWTVKAGRGDFGRWDCKRAGGDEAPSNALCPAETLSPAVTNPSASAPTDQSRSD